MIQTLDSSKCGREGPVWQSIVDATHKEDLSKEEIAKRMDDTMKHHNQK